MATDTRTRDDTLEDFEARKPILGKDRLIYVAGAGPAVIVMTEMMASLPMSRGLPAGCVMPASRCICHICSARTERRQEGLGARSP